MQAYSLNPVKVSRSVYQLLLVGMAYVVQIMQNLYKIALGLVPHYRYFETIFFKTFEFQISWF